MPISNELSGGAVINTWPHCWFLIYEETARKYGTNSVLKVWWKDPEGESHGDDI